MFINFADLYTVLNTLHVHGLRNLGLQFLEIGLNREIMSHAISQTALKGYQFTSGQC